MLDNLLPWLASWLNMYELKSLGMISMGSIGQGVVVVGNPGVCRCWVHSDRRSTILTKSDFRRMREQPPVPEVGGVALPGYFAGAFKGMTGELPDWGGPGFPFVFLVSRAGAFLSDLGLERLYLSRLECPNKTRVISAIGRRCIKRVVSYQAAACRLSFTPQPQPFEVVVTKQFPTNVAAIDNLIAAIGEESQTGIGPTYLRASMMADFVGITCHADREP